MKPVFFIITLMLAFALISPACAADGVDKVNIYTGHFLLQSWPQDKRMITMEIDTSFPPDTLVFQAISAVGGLKKAMLELRDMQGNLIEYVDRVARHEDETEATFIYILNQNNIRKIKDRKFRVILDCHQKTEPDPRNVALIFLHYSR